MIASPVASQYPRTLIQIRSSKPCHTCHQAKKTAACTQCSMTFYCSPKCQKEDWKNHKRVCLLVLAEIDTFNPPQKTVDKSFGYGVIDQTLFNRLSYTAMLECAALVDEQITKQMDLEKGFYEIEKLVGRWRQELAQLGKSNESEEFGVDRKDANEDYRLTSIDQSCSYKPTAIVIQAKVEEYLRQLGDQLQLSITKGACEIHIQIFTPKIRQQKMEVLRAWCAIEKKAPQEGPLRMLFETLDVISELATLRLKEQGEAIQKGKILEVNRQTYCDYLDSHDFLSIQMQYRVDANSKVYLSTYVTDVFKNGSQYTLHPTHSVISLLHPAAFNLSRIESDVARLWKEVQLKKILNS